MNFTKDDDRVLRRFGSFQLPSLVNGTRNHVSSSSYHRDKNCSDNWKALVWPSVFWAKQRLTPQRESGDHQPIMKKWLLSASWILLTQCCWWGVAFSIKKGLPAQWQSNREWLACRGLHKLAFERQWLPDCLTEFWYLCAYPYRYNGTCIPDKGNKIILTKHVKNLSNSKRHL